MTAAGRKYRMTIISALSLLAGYGVTCLNPALQSAYSELVTGIVGCLLVYCGGNVGNKWVGKPKPGAVDGTNK